MSEKMIFEQLIGGVTAYGCILCRGHVQFLGSFTPSRGALMGRMHIYGLCDDCCKRSDRDELVELIIMSESGMSDALSYYQPGHAGSSRNKKGIR